MPKSRGSSLVSVLMWVALVATLGFALAGLSIHHLSAMANQSCRQEALNLARSAVSQGIERLMVDTAYGKLPSTAPLLQVELSGTRPGAVGLLTFTPSLANDQEIPCSVNNLEGTAALPGSLRHVVPPAQAQLIGVGKSGGVTQKVVAYLAVPPFPYSLASAGPVRAEGGVTVGALPALPDGPVAADSTLLPADILSNDGTSGSIFLGANTRVTGDVRAAGAITLDPTAPEGSILVEGMLKASSSKEKIPHIPLHDYDPQAADKPFTNVESANYPGHMVIDGSNRRPGSLRVDQGLELRGGLLYVDGDLTISGGLTGKGVVVATGKVTVSGQSELVAGGGVALLAGKDLTLAGSGSQGSYLQGLVYTEGLFQADRVSVVGTLIAAGDGSDPVTLHDSRLLTPPPPPTPPPTPPATTGPPTQRVSFGASPNDVAGSGYAEWNGTNYVLTVTKSGVGTFTITITSQAQLIQDLTHLLQLTPAERPIVVNTVKTLMVRLTRTPGPNAPPTTPQNPVVITIDPSSFLRLQDRIRLVLWKEDD